MHVTFNDIQMVLPAGTSLGTITNYKSAIFSKGQKIGIKDDSNLIEIMENASDVCKRMMASGVSIDEASAFFKGLRGIASKGAQTDKYKGVLTPLVCKLEGYNTKIVNAIYDKAKRMQDTVVPPEIMEIRTPYIDGDEFAEGAHSGKEPLVGPDVLSVAGSAHDGLDGEGTFGGGVGGVDYQFCQVKKMMQEMRRLYNDLNTKYLMLLEKNKFMEKMLEELVVGNPNTNTTRILYKAAMERYEC